MSTVPPYSADGTSTTEAEQAQSLQPSRRASISAEQQEQLERKLRNRPNFTDDLVNKGIAAQANVAPSLAAVAKTLERNLISNKLNQKLQEREAPNELGETLLPGSNVAPRLRQAKIQLEQAITRDQLGHLLESRPQPDELYAHGVLQPPVVSSRIQGVAKQLQRHMTQDKVAHLLERRPDLEELERENILTDSTRVARSLQGTQRQLAHNLAKANLYHALKHRPSLAEVQKLGYLEPQRSQPGADESGQDEKHGDQAPQAQAQQKQGGYQQPMAYQRRSKNFHLTRILLKAVASMAEAGDISLQQKGFLKDLIVDQDQTILSIAEAFDTENDLNEFKEALYRLASSQRPS